MQISKENLSVNTGTERIDENKQTKKETRKKSREGWDILSGGTHILK